MLDIGWQELFLIAVVALVVVGPKDLPTALRAVARFVHKARGLSREFQSGLSEMMREAELDELKRKVEASARLDVGRTVEKAIDPTGSLREDFDPEAFARKLKDTVESGPPQGPMTRPAASADAPRTTPDSPQVSAKTEVPEAAAFGPQQPNPDKN
jgi:sec-independent protein translocase protein TatB